MTEQDKMSENIRRYLECRANLKRLGYKTGLNRISLECLLALGLNPEITSEDRMGLLEMVSELRNKYSRTYISTTLSSMHQKGLVSKKRLMNPSGKTHFSLASKGIELYHEIFGSFFKY